MIPIPPTWIKILNIIGTGAVMVLFLVYGMRLRTQEVWDGLTNFKLQGSVFIFTFLIFPLLGWFFSVVATPLLGITFTTGLLYLSLLPSTVQSSVSFTSIANGNVAGAVCAATISNVSGMFITPILVWLYMGAPSGFGTSQAIDVVVKLLLPFVIGQVLQPFLGDKIRANKYLTKGVDRGTILIVVAAGISSATARGLWSLVSWSEVAWLILFSSLLLASLLAITWLWGGVLKLSYPDRVALLMCGSKKSLATGLPMAVIIFPPTTVAAVTIPVIVFHQIQLLTAAVLSRKLARSHTEESTW